MILKAAPKTKAPIYDDVRKANPSYNIPTDVSKTKYVHLVPQLPKWTNKEYRSQNEIQNLFNLSCSCSNFKDRSQLFRKRDVRSLCKHIYWKITQFAASNYIDDLTKILAHDSVFHNQWLHQKISYKNDYMIIGFTNYRDSSWLNVYYPFYNNGWFNLSYSFKENRWRNGVTPPNDLKIRLYLREYILTEIND